VWVWNGDGRICLIPGRRKKQDKSSISCLSGGQTPSAFIFDPEVLFGEVWIGERHMPRNKNTRKHTERESCTGEPKISEIRFPYPESRGSVLLIGKESFNK